VAASGTYLRIRLLGILRIVWDIVITEAMVDMPLERGCAALNIVAHLGQDDGPVSGILHDPFFWL
jgi:hypothetical protein